MRAHALLAPQSLTAANLPACQTFCNLYSASEETFTADGGPIFCTSELLRQVIVAVGDVSVSDYEVLTRYELLEQGRVRATQVSAIYLDPRHPKYFQANGRAVAVYTFAWEMDRATLKDERGLPVVCVPTPKDVTQCV